MERTSSLPPFRPQLIELVQVLSGECNVVNYDNILVVLRIGGFEGLNEPIQPLAPPTTMILLCASSRLRCPEPSGGCYLDHKKPFSE
ncbi:MAG: hypothetical protein XD88_0743 [Methanocalculus sp. 52_23]|nr:MAG: hypothetical protein XD88_0743 [Methanocalculus sp. 52_23]